MECLEWDTLYFVHVGHMDTLHEILIGFTTTYLIEILEKILLFVVFYFQIYSVYCLFH